MLCLSTRKRRLLLAQSSKRSVLSSHLHRLQQSTMLLLPHRAAQQHRRASQSRNRLSCSSGSRFLLPGLQLNRNRDRNRNRNRPTLPVRRRADQIRPNSRSPIHRCCIRSLASCFVTTPLRRRQRLRLRPQLARLWRPCNFRFPPSCSFSWMEAISRSVCLRPSWPRISDPSVTRLFDSQRSADCTCWQMSSSLTFDSDSEVLRDALSALSHIDFARRALLFPARFASMEFSIGNLKVSILANARDFQRDRTIKARHKLSSKRQSNAEGGSLNNVQSEAQQQDNIRRKRARRRG